MCIWSVFKNHDFISRDFKTIQELDEDPDAYDSDSSSDDDKSDDGSGSSEDGDVEITGLDVPAAVATNAEPSTSSGMPTTPHQGAAVPSPGSQPISPAIEEKQDPIEAHLRPAPSNLFHLMMRIKPT